MQRDVFLVRKDMVIMTQSAYGGAAVVPESYLVCLEIL